MPYNPGIEYRGDQYAFQGISNFGRNIGAGIEEWKKKHDEMAQALGESDTIVSRALQTGTMTPDKYTEYLGSSAKQKEGIAAGIAKNQALDIADKEFQAQKDYQYAALQNQIKIAQMHIAAQGGGGGGMTPELLAAMQDAAKRGGKILAPTSAHSFQYLDEPGKGGDVHKPGEMLRDPTNGQVIGVWEGGDKLFKPAGGDSKPWGKLLDGTDNTNDDKKKDKGPPQSQGPFWDFGHYGPAMQPPGGFQPAPPPQAAQGTKVLSAQDQQALEWAQTNSNDPRAATILKKLGY